MGTLSKGQVLSTQDEAHKRRKKITELKKHTTEEKSIIHLQHNSNMVKYYQAIMAILIAMIAE